MMVKIGVTPSTWDEKSDRSSVNQDYIASVLRANAMPLTLPITKDRAHMDEMLSMVDGVLFTGGADVDPALYNEAVSPLCGELCPLRDETEGYLMEQCLKRNIPFLAICRGFELLNVILGGTLYQDIAAQMSKDLFHPDYQQPRTQVHDMRILSGTLLNQVTGLSICRVNSRHHQGIKTLAKGLIPNAIAPDGLVEGFEMRSHPMALAVQWHPEALSSYAPEAHKLFELLAARARERR